MSTRHVYIMFCNNDQANNYNKLLCYQSCIIWFCTKILRMTYIHVLIGLEFPSRKKLDCYELNTGHTIKRLQKSLREYKSDTLVLDVSQLKFERLKEILDNYVNQKIPFNNIGMYINYSCLGRCCMFNTGMTCVQMVLQALQDSGILERVDIVFTDDYFSFLYCLICSRRPYRNIRVPVEEGRVGIKMLRDIILLHYPDSGTGWGGSTPNDITESALESKRKRLGFKKVPIRSRGTAGKIV